MTSLLLLVLLSQAADKTKVVVTDSTTKAVVDVGDTTNKAVRVNCITGCSGGAGGGLTDTQLRATPVPVSGTFYQATQPVSGTFWQATQPVSGTVAVSGTVPVSGTFWQATQPVSGTVTATGPLTDTQLRATAVPVSLSSTTITGTAAVTQSGTWTVQPGNTANSTAWLTKDSSDGTIAAAAPTIAILAGAKAVADAASPTARAAGQLADNLADLEGRLLVHTDHPRRVMCRLTSSATTSTAVTGCAAPGAGLSIYITDISIYGGVAVGATAAASIQYGTGGTCGTGTTVVYDCQHGATGGCEAHLVTPRKAAANSEVCVLDATVGTKFINLSGYVAP